MRIFDTAVQELKYKVLKEVAKIAFNDELNGRAMLNISKTIVPGPNATMRCCIHKERAIVNDRIKVALGGDTSTDSVIEVMENACDECPVSHFEVGNACRGCIAKRCISVCPKNAITVKDQKAVIDSDACVECGRCMGVCPYNAISKSERPCERACKVSAITMDKNNKAQINEDKCISCGACVYQCPFGAIADKSYITDVIDLIKRSDNNKSYKVHAVIAPAIVSQFSYAKIGQVVSGIKQLGFFSVVEAALGADMVAYKEAAELKEKGFLTSSCCPAFVEYVEKAFPDMVKHVSHNISPMAQISEYIKRADPNCKVVFIGPCTAKKKEIKRDRIKDIVDSVLTFEELQALLDSRDIPVETLEEEVLDNASYYGRVFARSGGLTVAVEQALTELKTDENDDFKLNPIACNGITECRSALLRASKGVLPNNFIEGMACEGGCIGGAACLTHGPKDKTEVDRYGAMTKEKTITESIHVLKFIH